MATLNRLSTVPLLDYKALLQETRGRKSSDMELFGDLVALWLRYGAFRMRHSQKRAR